MTEVHLALVLALAVVVPLALTLDERAPGPALARLVTLAGVTGSASFLFDEGAGAAAVAALWLATIAVLAVRQLPRAVVGAGPRELPMAIASAYLVVGGVWFVLSRYGARPLGFGDDIVELTAVHFHYAGFVAPVLSFRLARWLSEHEPGSAAPARAAGLAVLAATPLTAAGITFEPALGAAGALLFAGGLTTASVLTMRFVVPRAAGAVRALLALSSLSVIVSMLLAVAYAAGQWLGTPAPSLPVMVRTHGALNALGFALAGLAGWSLPERKRGPEGPLS